MSVRRAAVAVATMLLATGCSVEPDHQASIMDVLANPSSSSTTPTPAVAAPVAEPLGTGESARGMTVTARAENVALTHLSQSDELELGIEVSFTGVTAAIDATGFNAGLRLSTSTGEELRTVPATVLTMPPLPAPVSADADGWVYFHLKPGAQPTELRLIAPAAASYYGPSGQPLAIWTMPATLPSPAPAPVVTPPAPAPDDPGSAPRSGPHPRHGSPFCRITRLC
ncbi:MAG: hypothetical protein HYZ39_21750 [Mycolicibacterium cosmeticum]|nr:hypothetical protein [Mycolicibacterium cosmeticum]